MYMIAAAKHSGYCKTPWGMAKLEHSNNIIYRFEFLINPSNSVCSCPISQTIFEKLLKNPKAFQLDPEGTEFQQSVWRALQQIPYGKTVSYADIACKIGKPKSYRAVANAIGANPICIFIPCHRVIRSDGSLGGFTSGIKLKKILMRREGISPPSETR